MRSSYTSSGTFELANTCTSCKPRFMAATKPVFRRLHLTPPFSRLAGFSGSEGVLAYLPRSRADAIFALCFAIKSKCIGSQTNFANRHPR